MFPLIITLNFLYINSLSVWSNNTANLYHSFIIISLSSTPQFTTRFINPITCIIHNLAVKYDANGKPYSKSLTWLRDTLRNNGYPNVKKVHIAWTKEAGFRGYGIIQFNGSGHDDFLQARKLAAVYASRHHQLGKHEFYTDDPDRYPYGGPYLWLAVAEDGHLLRNEFPHNLTTVPKSWEDEEVPHDDQIVRLIYDQVYPDYPPLVHILLGCLNKCWQRFNKKCLLVFISVCIINIWFVLVEM